MVSFIAAHTIPSACCSPSKESLSIDLSKFPEALYGTLPGLWPALVDGGYQKPPTRFGNVRELNIASESCKEIRDFVTCLVQALCRHGASVLRSPDVEHSRISTAVSWSST
jgi:hypothetical protein